MKNVVVEVKDEIFEQVNEILDGCDLDMEIAIKMFFKRIIREKSISFMLPKTDSCEAKSRCSDNSASTPRADKGEMRKSIAVRLFKERKNNLSNTVTYSSKNRTTHNFWANPSFSVLKSDWSLILNDWINRKLFLFYIPENSIPASILYPRNDQKNLIDLQILENVPGFVDKISGFSFKKFLIDEIDY